MAYGIDKEVSDRADVYASNPQALGFQYKKSGSVLDLIALKRIKDDLDKKRQEIALQYGQKAEQQKTVAEQTLEETKGLIQKDVTDQTSKLLTQNKKAQDLRLRKLAAGKRPNAPLGIPAAQAARGRGAPNPQMMAGIGNIPPRSPVNPRGKGIAANQLSNVSYGAKGGIVSFANQGSVKLNDAQLREMGMNRETWDSLTQGTKDIILGTYDPKGSPAYARNIAPLERRAALRAEADRVVRERPYWGAQLGEWLGGSEEGLADVVGERTTAGDRARLLRGIAEGKIDQWGVDESPADDAAVSPDPNATAVVPPVPAPAQAGDPTVQQDWAKQFLPREQFDEAAPGLDYGQELRKHLGKTMPDIEDESQWAEQWPEMPDATITAPSIADVDPDRAADLTTETGAVREHLKTISDQKPLEARGESTEWAGKVLDRSGVQSKYDEMLAAEQKQQTKIEADRAKYGMYNAFGDIGHYGLASLGDSYTRQRGRYREEDKALLGAQQGIRQEAITSYIDIGKEMVASGRATEESVRNSISNALRDRTAIIGQERSELSEEATRQLETSIANIEASDRRIASEQNKIAVLVGQETAFKTARLTAHIQWETSQIAALNGLRLHTEAGEKLVNELENNVVGIYTSYDEMASEQVSFAMLDANWANLSSAEQQAKKDDLFASHRALAEIQAANYRKAMAPTIARYGGHGLEVTPATSR